MENINETLSVIKLLETEIKSLEAEIDNISSAGVDKIFQESTDERQLRMKTVDADEAFSELLKKPEILNVFLRLRDK